MFESVVYKLQTSSIQFSHLFSFSFSKSESYNFSFSSFSFSYTNITANVHPLSSPEISITDLLDSKSWYTRVLEDHSSCVQNLDLVNITPVVLPLQRSLTVDTVGSAQLQESVRMRRPVKILLQKSSKVLLRIPWGHRLTWSKIRFVNVL